MNALLIALVVGGMAVLGQQLLARSTAKQRREEKQADWDRQDEKEQAQIEREKKVAAVAAVADAKTDDVAALLAETTAASAAASQVVTDKLDEIAVTGKVTHALVNSNLSVEKEARLTALKERLVMLNELIDFKKQHGMDPTPDTLQMLADSEKAIAQLQQEVTDRAETTEAATDIERKET